MGYYISHTIGIRVEGIFSGEVDREDVRQRIAKLVRAMREESESDKPDAVLPPDLGGDDGDPDHCMSKRLVSHKGAFITLAGVFNYWGWDEASEFSRRISEEFGTEVMHMCWDMEINTVRCQIFLAGRPLFEANENPIGRILRHVGGG